MRFHVGGVRAIPLQRPFWVLHRLQSRTGPSVCTRWRLLLLAMWHRQPLVVYELPRSLPWARGPALPGKGREAPARAARRLPPAAARWRCCTSPRAPRCVPSRPRRAVTARRQPGALSLGRPGRDMSPEALDGEGAGRGSQLQSPEGLDCPTRRLRAPPAPGGGLPLLRAASRLIASLLFVCVLV